MSSKWLIFDPIPSPLPSNWNDPNFYIDCKINGSPAVGKLILFDQSALPPTPISWPQFAGNPYNPNFVPHYYGPVMAGQPGVNIYVTVTLAPKTWKWAGQETCKWFAMGQTGYWQVTGFNYEFSAYPQ